MDMTIPTHFTVSEDTENNILSDCKQVASQVLHNAPIEKYAQVVELFDRSIELVNHEFVSLGERIEIFEHFNRISLLCREIRSAENKVLTNEQINECKSIFSQLSAFKDDVRKREKLCTSGAMNRFEGRVFTGVDTEQFLEDHDLETGPLDDKDDRVVIFNHNFKILPATPAEHLQYYYTAKSDLFYMVFSGARELAQVFSHLYYPTSENGQFLQLQEHIDQHEKYKHCYRKRDRMEVNCHSIETTLEGTIKEQDDRISKVEVFYHHEEERLYAKKFYYGGWHHSEPEIVPIDPEDFGYVNYNPEKHGSPGHFFMRYISKDLFGAIVARSGELHFGLDSIDPQKESALSNEAECTLSLPYEVPEPEKRLHDSSVGYYKLDAEGCTIWDRLIARIHKEGCYCSNLFNRIIENFEHSFHFLQTQSVYSLPLISLTSVLYRNFHPFFLQNTHTKDTFFHLAFRELSRKENSVEISLDCLFISLSQYIIRGSQEHNYGIDFHAGTLKSLHNYPTKEWCDMIVGNIDPSIIMQRLQILHGLFTIRNTKEQTPMDILSEQLLTNHDHRKELFTILFVQILSHLLYALAQLYEITEYDNLIARFIPLFDEELESLPEDSTLTERQEGNRMYLPSNLIDSETDKDRKNLDKIRTHEEKLLSEIPLEESLKKARIIFRQKLRDIILGLFGKREGNSVFENFMQSHFSWYHQRARIRPEYPETESVIAKFLYRAFYHEEFPKALRLWFLKSFEENSETQVSRLKDFFISLIYHHHQPGYGIPLISRSLFGFAKDIWHSLSSDQSTVEVKKVESTVDDNFVANGQNIEKTFEQLLRTVAEAEEPSECFKKKSLPMYTFLWRIVMITWNAIGKLWYLLRRSPKPL